MAIWRVYFAVDIHGSEACFRKFLRAGKFYGIRTMILAGDLVGKGMVPILKENGHYLLNFAGETRTLRTKDELQKWESMIGDTGFYPYVTERDEVAALQADSAFRDDLMNLLIVQRLQRWIEQLEESSLKDGIRYYISPGNDDPYSVDPVLNASKVVVNVEGRVVSIHEKIDMMTLGYVNPTPWHTAREVAEGELLQRLEHLAGRVVDPNRCIFCLHAPPYNTKLDIAPQLDRNLRMESGLSKAPFAHVGSTAVHTIIERCQPLVSVHGHIHESAGKDRIGKTFCFNPGSEYAQGVLRGIILTFDIDERPIFANYLSVSG